MYTENEDFVGDFSPMAPPKPPLSRTPSVTSAKVEPSPRGQIAQGRLARNRGVALTPLDIQDIQDPRVKSDVAV